jgi:hypothetical protein
MSTAPKRTEAERERDLVTISDLYVRGFTYREIAEKLKTADRKYTLSRQQIYYDVKEVREVWKSDHQDKMEGYLIEQLNKLDRLENEYWTAWEESKGEKEETAREDGQNGMGPFTKDVVKKWKSEGNAVFLAGVKDCIEKRAKLLGLYKEQVQHSGEMGISFNYIAPPTPTDND